MKFRAKIALSMTCLVAVLFGIGGSIWISASFQAGLSRQKELAANSVNLTVSLIQALGTMNGAEDSSSLPDTVKELWNQGMLADFTELSVSVSDGIQLLSLSSGSGKYTLSLLQSMEAGGIPYRLDFAYDITSLYEARDVQLKVYSLVYAGLVLISAALSYTIAWLLTRPLQKLGRASRRIAQGDLSSRSRIRGRDEIGLLSREFDAMADQVEQSVRSLQESMDQQQRFMGSFTHELKTPMTSIIGYADLLRSKALSESEQVQAAEYIFSEGKRLERMSLSLLNLFVMGQDSVELKPAEPAALTESYVEQLRTVYAGHGVSITCKTESGVCLLEADLFVTLLSNLIDNARKSLPESGGWIYVELKMTADGCALLVQDNGRGIPKEAMIHLSEAFYRVDKHRSRKQGGTGLGLSLCQSIVKLHGGELRFASEVGVGTDVLAVFRGGRA